MIVQLHQLQAMLHLGLVPNPATGQPNPVDLRRAEYELTLLEILEEKTKGNLNDEEEQLLGQVIVSLRNAVETLEQR